MFSSIYQWTSMALPNTSLNYSEIVFPSLVCQEQRIALVNYLKVDKSRYVPSSLSQYLESESKHPFLLRDDPSFFAESAKDIKPTDDNEHIVSSAPN